jgi:hypothetical protein
MIEVQLIIINKLGEFTGKRTMMSVDQYAQLIEMSKNFYKHGGFELTCDDGSFMVFSPDLVQQSVLKISKTELK